MPLTQPVPPLVVNRLSSPLAQACSCEKVSVMSAAQYPVEAMPTTYGPFQPWYHSGPPLLPGAEMRLTYS